MATYSLLLFSKPPTPGLVKTRLSTLKDGIYSAETAAWLYHCMLFDVCEICCAALDDLEHAYPHDTFNMVISTTPKDNVQVMQDLFAESGAWPHPMRFDYDEGASFDEHYNDAFEKAFAAGADAILSMGADMPSLTKKLVIEGFARLRELMQLEDGGCVISPDQQLGVSIIGWTRATNMDHTGVFYNPDGLTVLPAYIAKCRERGVRALYLPDIPDVDTMMDLYHVSTLVQTLAYCAQFDDIVVPHRTLDALAQLGLDDVRIAPNNLHDPREDIDTPTEK